MGSIKLYLYYIFTYSPDLMLESILDFRAVRSVLALLQHGCSFLQTARAGFELKQQGSTFCL